jgi:hypothetical protein
MTEQLRIRPLLPEFSDDSHQVLAESLGIPVRRDSTIPSIPLPSGKLLLSALHETSCLSIDGFAATDIAVIPQIWTLPDTTVLIGRLTLMNLPATDRFIPQERRRIKKLGRVNVTSGVLAVADAEIWSSRKHSLPHASLTELIQANPLVELSWGADRALLLKPGYGVGAFAVVADFDMDRIDNISMFLLKGNSP